MLQLVTQKELEALLTREHPFWAPQAVQQRAQEYHDTMDARLDALLRSYLDTGEMANFRQGEFSVIQIQRMRPGRSYFTALTLMDAYLKDAVNGRALILRR